MFCKAAAFVEAHYKVLKHYTLSCTDRSDVSNNAAISISALQKNRINCVLYDYQKGMQEKHHIFYLSSVTLFSERDQPSVLYRLKCLFSVLSCSTKGKTCRVILITRARKGGQRQQDLSHPSWSLFSLWPEAHLHLLSWKPQSLMSYVRGWHLPSNCLLPTLQTNTITVNGLDRISQKHPPTLHRSHCSVRL